MANRAHCMVVARDPSTGATLLSATVNVYSPGTVTPISATIFDKNGNTLSNPLTSDPTTGLVDFYLNVAQEVDLVVAKAGYTTRTYSNVPVLDDAGYELTSLLTTTGDLPYASSANTPARLPIGSTGAFLTVSGGVPAWSNTIAAGGLQVTAGNVGIGTAPETRSGIAVTGSILSGNTQQYGVNVTVTANSSATTDVAGFVAAPATAAAAFTCAQVSGFHALNPTKGSGSTITSAYGLLVDSVTVGNTNNYGIFINAPSGGSTENYAIKTNGRVYGSGFSVDNELTGVSGTTTFTSTIAGLGGGATATLGTIGGSGPASAAQASWMKIYVGTSARFIPVWA